MKVFNRNTGEWEPDGTPQLSIAEETEVHAYYQDLLKLFSISGEIASCRDYMTRYPEGQLVSLRKERSLELKKLRGHVLADIRADLAVLGLEVSSPKLAQLALYALDKSRRSSYRQMVNWQLSQSAFGHAMKRLLPDDLEANYQKAQLRKRARARAKL